MNNRRANYYPLLAYLLLLLMVWIGEFFADVMQLLFGAELPTSSLISAEGVRWAIRTALPSIGAVPWGMVMLLVATYGLLRGSGLVKVLVRLVCLRRLTLSEWRALLFSLAAAVCYAVLLYMSTVAPWNILSGVTHEPALSPLLQGWVLLLFIGTLFVSLIYGFIYGNFRSIMDVVVSTADTFVLFIPAIMALLPASGIVPCLQYAGVQQASDMLWSIIETVLYMLPFLYVLFMEIRCK